MTAGHAVMAREVNLAPGRRPRRPWALALSRARERIFPRRPGNTADVAAIGKLYIFRPALARAVELRESRALRL